jgi:carboxyl-terminal processing protease
MRIARTLAASLLLGACSQPSAPAPTGNAVTTTASAPAAAPMSAPASMSKYGEDDEPFMVQTEKFADGEKAFAEAKAAMLTKYYAEGLTDEDVYRAAVRGMVEDIDARMHRWNKLIGPRELALMNSDLSGEIVGIGVNIHFDEATGHIELLNVIPGTPADKAGLMAHDTILSVNGKLFKGRSLMDALEGMRGKAGDPVTLSVLRDDKIISVTIVRAKVALQIERHFVVDGVGYVRIEMFSATTAPSVKKALEELAVAKVHALVVDLRDNQGGSFDEAVHTAELFLPSGAPIVTLERRAGKKDVITSKGEPILASVPMAVLVDRGTSSGAELLTAALAEGRHAHTVGGKTWGKWSVQSVDELGNGYAIKYTTAIFHAPSGASYEGVGLTPDAVVDMDKAQVERALVMNDTTARLAIDATLRTALVLLK